MKIHTLQTMTMLSPDEDDCLKKKSFLSNEALPSSSLAWACTRNLAVEIFDCILNVKMDFLILDFYRKRVKFHYD